MVWEAVEAGVERSVKDEIEVKVGGGQYLVKGSFAGTVKKKQEGWPIDGAYTPPPLLLVARSEKSELNTCSVIEGDDHASLLAGSPRQVVLTGSPRDVLGWRTNEQIFHPPRKEPREAFAGPVTQSLTRSLGKCERRVKGTISARKDMITIELPPLPILDYRCRVVDMLPEKKLELVRQESGKRGE
jgi:hypothetical protein